MYCAVFLCFVRMKSQIRKLCSDTHKSVIWQIAHIYLHEIIIQIAVSTFWNSMELFILTPAFQVRAATFRIVQFLWNLNKRFVTYVLCSVSVLCKNEKSDTEIVFRHSQICHLTDCTYLSNDKIVCPLTNNPSFGQFLQTANIKPHHTKSAEAIRTTVVRRRILMTLVPIKILIRTTLELISSAGNSQWQGGQMPPKLAFGHQICYSVAHILSEESHLESFSKAYKAVFLWTDVQKMDEWVRVLCPINSISVFSRWWCSEECQASS